MGCLKKIVFMSQEATLNAGGEISLVDLIRGLRNKYEVFCLVPKDGPLVKEFRKLKCSVIFCDVSWSRKLKYVVTNYYKLIKIAIKLKKISPDLLYANAGYINPFGVKLAKILKIRLITHIHAFFLPVDEDRYQFGKTDAIITNSEKVARAVNKFNVNVRVIQPAISSDKFNPKIKLLNKEIRRRLGFNDDEILIGNIGTISEIKGYFEFVEVANEVLKEFPVAKFLIIGVTQDPVVIGKLKRKIKDYHLEEKIVFMGFVNEIENIFSILDVFLFPARYEAFGRVIIEAFACKVPVISSKYGGPEEIIEDRKDGFLFEIGDILGMTRCVIELIKNRELADRIAENAYQKFTDRFTVERMISKIDNVIMDLI